MSLIRGALVRLSLPDARGLGAEGTFYAALGERVRFIPNPSCGFLACVYVDRNAQVCVEIEPTAFAELEPSQRAGLVLHELLHIALGHIFERPGAHLRVPWVRIACDISVNQLIPAHLPLPDGEWSPWTLDVLNERRARVDLPAVGARLPWEGYYRALEELARAGDDPNGYSGPDDHEPPAGADVPHELREAACRQILEAAENAAKLAGAPVPKVVQQAIEALRRPSGMRWREMLRAFAQSAMSFDHEFTRRRPSRRFGFAQPGRRRELRAKIVFAVDTSASMDAAQLAMVLPEIERLSQLADVEVVDIDTEIRRTWRARGRIEVAEFKGRGGTAFSPLFAAVREGRFGVVDGVIYFTDGYGDSPGPCGVPTLWLLTDEAAPRQSFGRSLVIPPP